MHRTNPGSHDEQPDGFQQYPKETGLGSLCPFVLHFLQLRGTFSKRMIYGAARNGISQLKIGQGAPFPRTYQYAFSFPEAKCALGEPHTRASRRSVACRRAGPAEWRTYADSPWADACWRWSPRLS
jgi:hypothetical protein